MGHQWSLMALETCLFHQRVITLASLHRSPVNSPHKGQWRGALMFSLICAWMKCWVNNREAGDLRHHCTHYDNTVMDGGDSSSLTCMDFIYFSPQDVFRDGIRHFPASCCWLLTWWNILTFVHVVSGGWHRLPFRWKWHQPHGHSWFRNF